ALHKADKDPEHIHQLRVGARRANAALRIFALCLADKVHRSARKTLRKIRRAAGEARDWDVFHDLLAAWSQKQLAARRAGVEFLQGFAKAQRDAAQQHLCETAGDHPLSFDAFFAETVAAVQPPDDPTLRHLIDLAQPFYARLLQELDEAAARDLDDYDNLHQVRIAGKRLRYAMEVFADCFAKPFRTEIYPAAESMQDILGRANDSRVAAGRLESLRQSLRAAWPAEWKRYRPGIEAYLRYQRQQLTSQRRQFAAWWKNWKKSG